MSVPVPVAEVVNKPSLPLEQCANASPDSPFTYLLQTHTCLTWSIGPMTGVGSAACIVCAVTIAWRISVRSVCRYQCFPSRWWRPVQRPQRSKHLKDPKRSSFDRLGQPSGVWWPLRLLFRMVAFQCASFAGRHYCYVSECPVSVDASCFTGLTCRTSPDIENFTSSVILKNENNGIHECLVQGPQSEMVASVPNVASDRKYRRGTYRSYGSQVRLLQWQRCGGMNSAFARTDIGIISDSFVTFDNFRITGLT